MGACSAMSQSDEHRLLVLNAADALIQRYPEVTLVTDIQASPGDPVPPLIDRYRPDIYAWLPQTDSLIIGEAKTHRDIWNSHTRNQVRSFVAHIEKTAGGRFILCAWGHNADRAKTLLRFLMWELHPSRVSAQVFDGHDFWTLDADNGVLWHLD